MKQLSSDIIGQMYGLLCNMQPGASSLLAAIQQNWHADRTHDSKLESYLNVALA